MVSKTMFVFLVFLTVTFWEVTELLLNRKFKIDHIIFATVWSSASMLAIHFGQVQP